MVDSFQEASDSDSLDTKVLLAMMLTTANIRNLFSPYEQKELPVVISAYKGITHRCQCCLGRPLAECMLIKEVRQNEQTRHESMWINSELKLA